MAVALRRLLLLAICVGVGARKRGKAEKTSKLEWAQCDEGPCSEWDADERPNCVMQCQSEACYASTFAGNELEPGEVDVVRGRQYQSCLTRERSERLRAEGRRARSGR